MGILFKIYVCYHAVAILSHSFYEIGCISLVVFSRFLAIRCVRVGWILHTVRFDFLILFRDDFSRFVLLALLFDDPLQMCVLLKAMPFLRLHNLQKYLALFQRFLQTRLYFFPSAIVDDAVQIVCFQIVVQFLRQ